MTAYTADQLDRARAVYSAFTGLESADVDTIATALAAERATDQDETIRMTIQACVTALEALAGTIPKSPSKRNAGRVEGVLKAADLLRRSLAASVSRETKKEEATT